MKLTSKIMKLENKDWPTTCVCQLKNSELKTLGGRANSLIYSMSLGVDIAHQMLLQLFYLLQRTGTEHLTKSDKFFLPDPTKMLDTFKHFVGYCWQTLGVYLTILCDQVLKG